MTEETLGLGDPVFRRLQEAFSNEEPATDLAAVLQRAARYQSGEPPGTGAQPLSRHGLTATDLAAARRREPAAVARIYAAYAPALSRFFMAEVGHRQEAQDLVAQVFLSAIEGLPKFHGPVEALGGWLFKIARHDLYDFRRRQARSRTEPLDDNPDEALNRLSPREREVLRLVGRGWSNRQIADRLFVSPHTVRTHVENILAKLGMHSKLEAVTFAMEHGSSPGSDDPEEVAIDRLEGSRVRAALHQLSPDQREVLVLRMAGLTIPEVADVLRKTTGAVKSLQHRGLASLARVLGVPIAEEPQDDLLPSPDLGVVQLTRQEQQEG